jgi:DmsE family decaheme c-type cytochrome
MQSDQNRRAQRSAFGPFAIVPVLAALAIAAGGDFLSAQTPAAPSSPQANSFVGNQACQACHPDLFHGFNRNPHFKSIALANEPPERTGCEGCHGPGEAHIKGMGDRTKIVVFPDLAPNEVLDNCLQCHAKDLGKVNIRRSSHSTGEVSCLSCHSIHSAPELGPLLAKTERETCYGCHLEIRARFELPFKHRVNEGAIDCTDCHNPHGAPVATWRTAQSPQMVTHALGNDIACVKCHSDKRGPFVYEHAPVRVEGCTMCHNPHGSVNPRLLARPATFTLCLECHNNVMGFGTREEGIPAPSRSSHNLATPAFQNCLNCHVRIHGSNVDALFRR